MQISVVTSLELEQVLQPVLENTSFSPQYHPVWLNILSEMGEDCHALVARQEGEIVGWVFYSLLRRPDGDVLNSMPFLPYGGPVAVDDSIEVVSFLLQSLRDKAVQMNVDVLNVVTSPFLSPELEGVYRSSLQVTHEHGNFVQIQPLEKHPLEQLPSKRRKVHRRRIRRAEEAGLKVINKLNSNQLEQWLDIYQKRYSQIGATPYPSNFYRLIAQQAVSEGVAEFWGVTDGDQLTGGALFLVTQKNIDCFSTAFDSEYNDRFPMTLLMNAAFESFVERKIPWFNWQSSPTREGGVYQYKKEWGAQDGQHYYFSILLNSETKLFQREPETLRRDYPFRFVLPYSAFNYCDVN